MIPGPMQDAMDNSNLQHYCQEDCIMHDSQHTTAQSNTKEVVGPSNQMRAAMLLQVGKSLQ